MLGTGISANDAFYISRNGMWVYVGGEELFIDFKRYPMLKSKTIGEISDFKIDKFGNLRWEDLDIDIERDALRHPEKYPLIANQ